MQVNRRKKENCRIFLYFWSLIYALSSGAECNDNNPFIEVTSHLDNLKKLSDAQRTTRHATKILDELFQKRLFNTTMNFIVPGAKVNLPRHTEEGSVDHLAMQAFFGLFWAAAWIATIAIPVSHTYFQPLGIRRSINNGNNDVWHFKWKLDKEYSEKIGLDWKSCIQKSICQAHEFPDKYGLLGKFVQILFPAGDKLDDDEFIKRITFPFERAAQSGAIGQDCCQLYTCFFDILDVILYVKEVSVFTLLPV